MSPLIPASPLAFGGSFPVDRKQLGPEEPLSHLHPGSCFGGLAVLNITSFSAVVSLQRLQVSGRTHIYWGIPFSSNLLTTFPSLCGLLIFVFQGMV